MKKIASLSLLCLMILATAFAQKSERIKFNFNSDWKVRVGDTTGAEAPSFNDDAWKVVTLPYAWNENDAFRVSIDQLATGIAWYRKHFIIDEITKEKRYSWSLKASGKVESYF